MNGKDTSYDQIITWLKTYCANADGTRVYKGLEQSEEFKEDVKKAQDRGVELHIDPMLPIDLVAVRPSDEIDDISKETIVANRYTLFWFVPPDYPLSESQLLSLERKLQFYRFYLSRISKTSNIELIIVIATGTDIQAANSLEGIAKYNGFGLWKVDPEDSKPSELWKPRDLLTRIAEEFANPNDPEALRFCSKITAKSRDITLFFDKYVREAVEAVVGITPKEIGKRYIERQILDLVFQLNNISYSKTLTELITRHLVEKGSEYEFVSNTFSQLWSECRLGLNYTDFLKVYEPPLLNIFADQGKPYRDHYLHQFQVFILGIHIINKLKTIDRIKDKLGPNIDKQWLITSSFHDIAYPLQRYNDWASEFFKDSLGIPDIGLSDFKSSFIDSSHLTSLGFLLNAFCQKYFGRELRGNWLHDEKPLVQFLHERLTKLKHHCLLSSLYLLREAQKGGDPLLLNDLFVPSALAIAMHNYLNVWRKQEDGQATLPDDRKLNSLKFDTDPLAFLLMFCDCAQEWGRPSSTSTNSDAADAIDKRFILVGCDFSNSVGTHQSSECLVTVRGNVASTDSMFSRKEAELQGLEEFLAPPQHFAFRLTLLDKHGLRKEFSMQGRPQD